MKKLLMLGLMAGLLASSLAAPATAGKKAKPVKTTLYMHGNYQVGDLLETIGEIQDGTYPKMDTTPPAAGAPKSQSYMFPVGNDQCSGNTLFPSWEGKIAGTITGDMKLVVNTLGAPSKFTAAVFADVPFAACTQDLAGVSDYQPPIAQQVVDVPPGLNELTVVFPKLKKNVKYNLTVMLYQTGVSNVGRVLYDSADYDTRLEFGCIPAKGKSCA